MGSDGIPALQPASASTAGLREVGKRLVSCLCVPVNDNDDNRPQLTNAFTVLRQRIFGDLYFDGDGDAEDKAMHPALSPDFG